MAEERPNLFQEFAKELQNIHLDVKIALRSPMVGDWISNNHFKSESIQAVLLKNLIPDQNDVLQHPTWIISVRNSHLYKELVDFSYSELYKMHGQVVPVDEVMRKNESRVAEEQLHSTPTLDQDFIKDRIYCCAFLQDIQSRKCFIQSFFTYNDPTDNYKLLVDVAENPHRILGTVPMEIDKSVLDNIK